METLTPNEIAKILRIHPFSVTRLARQKKLPAFKVGGVWRFRKDQFFSWIETQTKTPVSISAGNSKRQSRKRTAQR